MLGPAFVVAPDIDDAVVRAEIGAVSAETGEVAVEGVAGRLLHRVVEEAHRVARVAAGAVPVFDLAPGAEDFGEDQGVVADDVVLEEHVGFVGAGVGVAAALVVVPLRLVQEAGRRACRRTPRACACRRRGAGRRSPWLLPSQAIQRLSILCGVLVGVAGRE